MDVLIPFLQDLIADGHFEAICSHYAAKYLKEHPRALGSLHDDYQPKGNRSIFQGIKGFIEEAKQKTKELRESKIE